MKGLFGRKKKRDDRTERQTGPADEDETIFINLSGDEIVDPDKVRVVIEPEEPRPPAGATPVAPTAHAAPPIQPESERAAASLSDPTAGPGHEGDDRTQVWTAGGTAPRPASQDPVAAAQDATVLQEPRAHADSAAHDLPLTAGLLMIVEGKGRGQILGLGLGRNKLGRGEDNEVVINYGDDAISRSNHATIAVDPKTERFFMVPGDSTNLAYLDEEPLLEVKEIADKSVIQLGETKLIFVQVLGNYLDWS